MTKMMTKEEQAKTFFKEGYNCSQAVFLAFAGDLNIDKNTLLKLTSSFGGGMGRLREVCGAVSGMFMVAGMLHGYTDPNDNHAKTQHYRRIQKLARKFTESHRSIICRELLGLNVKSENPSPEERTSDYYKKRPCVQLVGDAARILDEMLQQDHDEKVNP